jgi:uncharacterized protein (DUF885 family)
MLFSLFKPRFQKSLAHLIIGALTAGQLAVAYAQNAQPALQALPAPATAPVALNPRLARIAERYFEDHLVLNPLEASGLTGEARFDGLLTITIAPAQMARERALSQRVLTQLAAIKGETLSPADAITYAVLKRQLQEQIEGDKFPKQLMPIDQYGGLPVYVAQLGSGQDIQPLKTVKNYEDYLARLNKLPLWIDQAMVNMREGIKRGIVQPKPLMVSGLPAIKALAEPDVEKSVFYTPIKNMPATFAAQDRARLTALYRQAIQKRLIPSATRLNTFIETEYIPKARASAGISAIPNGAAWYAFQVKSNTTTDMTPEQIHALGLKEVARIRAEMAKVQAVYKFEGSVTEFLKWHEQQPEFRPFKTEKDVLDAYEAINKKVAVKLPQLFGRMPKVPIEIRPEPELTRATASDHYSGPSADGSRPGVFYAVIEDPSKYRTTGMTTLFLHEGQPGHHFHIALQQELALPKFRKYGWITAYGEGWALYAETLGREMGLYDDPNAYLGHLQDELLRAVRLVTDTGLHSKGWTREATMQYMMDNEGVSEAEARRATERYMAWPGQALAYKIGALKIQALRERSQQKLGAKFSLKEYHDLVLSNGVLPLAVLETKVNEWIAGQQ